MRTDSLSFPHPVLGVGDDVQGYHSVELTIMFSRETVRLKVNHTFYNDTIEKLIDKEKAVFCTQIICPKTIFREIRYGKEKNQVLEISQNDLRDKVTLHFFVIAADNIFDYENTRAHTDYKGFKFSVNKGDVLSVGGSSSFVADKKWLSTKAVSSFMTIRCGNKKDGPIDIDLSAASGKIVITLSKKDFKRYQTHRQNDSYYPIYHSCIVFPALSFAINAMMSPDGKEEFEDCLWYQVLEDRRKTDDKLRELGWDVLSVPEIAQAVLENPIDRVFSSMDKISTAEEEQD